MDKILVTGGAGFIGSHVVTELLGRGFSVVVLDDFSTGKLENLPCENEFLRIINGSILDKQKVTEGLRDCRALIHLAAVASVQASVDDPQASHRVNFDGTLLLLEEARKAGVKRFLFASSAAVYGDAAQGAVSENSPVSPLTPYAVDKLTSEFYLGFYRRSFGINFTAFRFFNVYGPKQDPSSPYSGVISIFISNFVAGKPVTFFGDGMQSRDFVFVKDLSKILIDSIDNPKTFDQTINIGTGKSISLLEIATNLAVILEREIEYKYDIARVGDIRHSMANVTLLHSLYADSANTPIQDGLRMTVEEIL